MNLTRKKLDELRELEATHECNSACCYEVCPVDFEANQALIPLLDALDRLIELVPHKHDCHAHNFYVECKHAKFMNCWCPACHDGPAPKAQCSCDKPKRIAQAIGGENT